MSENLIHISNKPSEQVLELLEENCIGTPGKSMVYRQSDVREKVLSLENAYFANLSIRDRLYGTICLCKRDVYNFNNKHKAFYLRYFTFRKQFRAANAERKSRQTESRIGSAVEALMEGDGLEFHGNLMLYAYVDPGNIRSRYIIEEFGFQKIGSFRVMLFSRIFPVNHSNVKIAENSQHDFIRSVLKDSYKNTQLVVYENLFRRGKYFVLMDGDQIVCGAQAISDQWEILEMPGVGGKLMMNFVPKIPLLNRLFHSDYKFIFFEYVFCMPGYAKKLKVLFESVLAHFSVNSGILCLDKKSKIYDMVKANRIGISHLLQGEKEIDVVVKSSDQSVFHEELPIHVSGFDVL